VTDIKREQKIIELNTAGCFYRFVNNKLSCKRGLGALGDGKGGVIVSDAERADLLIDYFSSVCMTDNGAVPTVERLVPTGVDIESVDFTTGKVHAAIKKLDVGGSSGPNGFPPVLFSKTADCIVGPIVTHLLVIYVSW